MITGTTATQAENNKVLTLALVKEHLAVEDTLRDNLITLYLGSAQAMAENKTGRAVGLQTFVMLLDCFDTIVFGKSSNDAITKIEYYPEGSDELSELPGTAYSVTDYSVDSLQLAFVGTLPALSLRDDAVKVTVGRGYAAAACPEPIKTAMLLMIADSLERREDRGEVGYNSASDNLLRAYRKW